MELKKPTRVVTLPGFEEIKGEEPGETICNLYRHLLPDSIDKPAGINPSKIRMNYDDCRRYMKEDQAQYDKQKAKKLGLMWMNQGPAADRKVPPGEIHLHEGYVTEDGK